MIDSSEQLGLFAAPRPVEVATPRGGVGVQAGAVRWGGYGPARRVQCQHCVLVAHERGGVGGVDIRTASRRRVSGDGELLLCVAHGDVQHAADVQAGLIGRKPRVRRRVGAS